MRAEGNEPADLRELAPDGELSWLAARTLIVVDGDPALAALAAETMVHLLVRPGDLGAGALGFRLRTHREALPRVVRGRRGVPILGGAIQVGEAPRARRAPAFVLDLVDAEPELRRELSPAALVSVGAPVDPTIAAELSLSFRGDGGGREISPFDHAPSIWSASVTPRGDVHELEVFGAGTLLGRTLVRSGPHGARGALAMVLALATVTELQLVPVTEALDALPRFGTTRA